MTVAELVVKLGIRSEAAVWFTTEHDPVTYGEEFDRLNGALRDALGSMGSVGRALATMGEALSRVEYIGVHEFGTPRRRK